jgi:drug/metabolite transporter (DMT)-like permease
LPLALPVAPSPGFAAAAALAAAFCWTVASLLWRRLPTALPAPHLNLLKNLLALALQLPLVLAQLPSLAGAWSGASAGETAQRLGMLAASGVLGIALGDSFHFAALRRLGTRRCLTLEAGGPALTTLAGLALLGEVPRGGQWLGVGLITLAVLLVARQRPPRQGPPDSDPAPQASSLEEGCGLGPDSGLGSDSGLESGDALDSGGMASPAEHGLQAPSMPPRRSPPHQQPPHQEPPQQQPPQQQPPDQPAPHQPAPPGAKTQATLSLATAAEGPPPPGRAPESLTPGPAGPTSAQASERLGLAFALADLVCACAAALLARAALLNGPFTPLQAATLRLGAASLVLTPLLGGLPPPRRWRGLASRHWALVLTATLLGTSLCIVLQQTALAGLPGGLAVALLSTSSLTGVLIAPLEGDSPGRAGLMAAAACLLGVSLVVGLPLPGLG